MEEDKHKDFIEIHKYISESTFQIKVKNVELNDVIPVDADILRLRVRNHYLTKLYPDHPIWMVYHKQ